MNNYKHFIAGVTNLVLEHVHVITEVEDGVKPQVSSFVKLIDAVQYRDGYYHTYYKDMKAVMKSFIIYWRQTMDLATKRADYLSHMAAESVDKELLVLDVVNTIRLWHEYQNKFNKDFLPIESPEQQKIYDEITEKFTGAMKQIYQLKLDVEKMDRRPKLVDFAKEHYAKSVGLKNTVFQYAHTYLSMLLADHLPEIGGSLKEVLNETRKNLKQLEEEREALVNDLLQKLYEKNKEQLMCTRLKKGSVSQMAEINDSIKKIREQVLNSGNHDAIKNVTERLKLFEERFATFEQIAKNLTTLKAELEKIYIEESIYNSRTTTELPGVKFYCWNQMGKNFAIRKEELKQLLIKAAKSLTTFFVVKSTCDEVMLYENDIGIYSLDIYGHIVYHFDCGLRKVHLDCKGNYKQPYDNYAIYIDENGQYYLKNNKKIYQDSFCRSQYKLGDDLLMKKVSKDCGHSERTVENCGMCVNNRAVPEILPNLQSMDIRGTLDSEVVKYLWDAVGAILPDALYEVCKLRPRNPIHSLGHYLLKHKYSKTPAELLRKKKESEAYRADVLKERKEKAVAESLAFKAKQPKRRKPEHYDDSNSREVYDIYVATQDFIASLDYYYWSGST